MRRTATNPWIVLVLVCLAQFMVVLDATIVNVALPSIQTDLDLSDSSLQWIINAYTLVFGGFLLLGGRLGDLLGRKRLFLIGLVIFTGASLLDGLATGETMLIGARALQGLGAALIAPAALSIITTTFEEGAERARALGVWAAIAIGGSAVGLILGGVITQYFSWPWIFFVNVPVGIVAFVLSNRLISESRDEDRPSQLRHRRRRRGNRRSDDARLRTRRRAISGLDVGPHDRALHLRVRPPRRIHRDRAARKGAARAPLDLPRALPPDREHLDVPRDVGDLRDVLLQHPLHPASARLRAARSRARVPALHVRDRGVRGARVAVRTTPRRAPRRGHGLPARRSWAPPADAAARSTAPTSPTCCRR